MVTYLVMTSSGCIRPRTFVFMQCYLCNTGEFRFFTWYYVKDRCVMSVSWARPQILLDGLMTSLVMTKHTRWFEAWWRHARRTLYDELRRRLTSQYQMTPWRVSLILSGNDDIPVCPKINSLRTVHMTSTLRCQFTMKLAGIRSIFAFF